MLEATVEAPHNIETYDARDSEYCPACGHTWAFGGPAHYFDCRYFALDDDRDEEPLVRMWATKRDAAVMSWLHINL